jgi:hypothetical protein
MRFRAKKCRLDLFPLFMNEIRLVVNFYFLHALGVSSLLQFLSFGSWNCLSSSPVIGTMWFMLLPAEHCTCVPYLRSLWDAVLCFKPLSKRNTFVLTLHWTNTTERRGGNSTALHFFRHCSLEHKLKVSHPKSNERRSLTTTQIELTHFQNEA